MNRRFITPLRWVVGCAAMAGLLIISGVADFIRSTINNMHITQNFELDTVNYFTTTNPVSGLQRRADHIRSIKPHCKETPKGLIGKVPLPNVSPDMQTIELTNPEVKDGSYDVRTCESKYRIAIIIPLRGRSRNFRQMLSHMHPIWQRQELSYTVFVITQAGNHPFNKAKLMNAGFKEARSYGMYDCFVFHDVDALLEDDRCLYWCNPGNPRHLCVYANVFNYKEYWYNAVCSTLRDMFTQTKLFGGVTMFTAEQFIRINGFSNYYWSWGGEDDDMHNRLINEGYDITNPHGRHCSYTLLEHPRNTVNLGAGPRHALIYHAISRQHKEGLKTVRYNVLSYEHNPLYVNITVDVGTPIKRMHDFHETNLKSAWFPNYCILRMPWNS